MNHTPRNVLLLLVLGFLHLLAICPGFFAPYDYAVQNRDLPFAPPSHLHLVDASGHLRFRPFVYAVRPSETPSAGYEEDHSHVYSLHLFVNGSPYRMLGLFTLQLHLFGVETPGQAFLLGTDDFGRDELSRLLYGSQISLFAGILGAATALLAGGLMGMLSGYYGGWLEAVIMRASELFLALPWLYLLFAVRALLPLRIKTTDTFLLLVCALGFVGWARPARLVRGIVLSAKERTYTRAATAMGASGFHILRRHILPETYGVILTAAALLVPQFILTEVTLSFLGLGVGEPMPSWGNLLSELQTYSVLSSYWWMYAPAIALVILFLAYHMASSALEETSEEVRA